MREVIINFYGANKHLSKVINVKDGLSTSEVMKECFKSLNDKEKKLIWDWNYKND